MVMSQRENIRKGGYEWGVVGFNLKGQSEKASLRR